MVDRFPMRKEAVLAILLGEMLDVSRGQGGEILEALDIVPAEERERRLKHEIRRMNGKDDADGCSCHLE